MTTLPKISVIIPCYNAESYIATAIRSALAQEWENLQIVVVDDGSSDRSFELVRDTFPGVKLLRQVNQGVAAARNTGIAQAQGDWIAFLDADDIWLPGKLQVQWEILNATPGARMAYTAWHIWTSADPAPPPEYVTKVRCKSNAARCWSGPSGWVYPQLLLDCVVWTSTVLAHRSVFAEVGVFDPELRIGEDYDLWLRASRVTQILRVPAPYALYRMHPASITKLVPEKNYRELVVSRALARWGYSSPDGGTARKVDVDRALATTWSDFAIAHLAAGNNRRALYAGLSCLRKDWRHVSGWKVLAKVLVRSWTRGVPPKPRI